MGSAPDRSDGNGRHRRVGSDQSGATGDVPNRSSDDERRMHGVNWQGCVGQGCTGQRRQGHTEPVRIGALASVGWLGWTVGSR
jgi:hypothetical protein